jgi:hypothetical protein
MEERLRARTSDLEAWNKTMLPTIRLTISEAQNQILTGHQDIRTFSRQGSASTKHERNARYRDRNDRHHEPRPHLTSPNDLRQRQRPKQESNQPTTTPTSTRRSSYHDIRHYTSDAKLTVAGSNLASNANRHGSIQRCEQTKQGRSIRSGQAGSKVGAKVHHPITGKRQLLLQLARHGHRKRSRFRLIARACLLSRWTTRFCTNTITTVASATVTVTATVTTDRLSLV